MRKIILVLTSVCLSLLSAQSYAGDGHNHSNEKHCEKKVDGKPVHLDHVKDKKQCKKEGGRWVKHKKKDDHDHGSHSDHKEGDVQKH